MTEEAGGQLTNAQAKAAEALVTRSIVSRRRDQQFACPAVHFSHKDRRHVREPQTSGTGSDWLRQQQFLISQFSHFPH